ncbi:hypothetical protein GPECTOR_67g317 [Gonium pectorale]|uniref:Uncharacterized protein n=1 Tax=Gonium pectorale TaxID=33097 RepID=A0A150G3Q3_GONPE|nr:hypothetical protein GPECTOR_67g317 [Gonium pectorale]|eukprot:KXZ44477.1 hypothetical protein GPECTOR_67g317 [Gonium pectorale]
MDGWAAVQGASDICIREISRICCTREEHHGGRPTQTNPLVLKAEAFFGGIAKVAKTTKVTELLLGDLSIPRRLATLGDEGSGKAGGNGGGSNGGSSSATEGSESSAPAAGNRRVEPSMAALEVVASHMCAEVEKFAAIACARLTDEQRAQAYTQLFSSWEGLRVQLGRLLVLLSSDLRALLEVDALIAFASAADMHGGVDGVCMRLAPAAQAVLGASLRASMSVERAEDPVQQRAEEQAALQAHHDAMLQKHQQQRLRCATTSELEKLLEKQQRDLQELCDRLDTVEAQAEKVMAETADVQAVAAASPAGLAYWIWVVRAFTTAGNAAFVAGGGNMPQGIAARCLVAGFLWGPGFKGALSDLLQLQTGLRAQQRVQPDSAILKKSLGDVRRLYSTLLSIEKNFWAGTPQMVGGTVLEAAAKVKELARQAPRGLAKTALRKLHAALTATEKTCPSQLAIALGILGTGVTEVAARVQMLSDKDCVTRLAEALKQTGAMPAMRSGAGQLAAANPCMAAFARAFVPSLLGPPPVGTALRELALAKVQANVAALQAAAWELRGLDDGEGMDHGRAAMIKSLAGRPAADRAHA